MKPPPFDYFAPTTTDEAISLLSKYGENAKILAGGQSLVPLLNLRLARPQVLVDINGIKELSYIAEADGGLRIGALTRHRAVETSPIVQKKCPLLAFAADFIGHVAIRNRGTFGGSLAHADPAAEFPLVLAALGGRIAVRSAQGERTLNPDQFFLSYLTTSLQPTEILTEVWLPGLEPHMGWGFRELALQQGAFALVSIAAVMTLDKQGVCTDARVALGSAAPAPLRAKAAENLLRGEKPNQELLAEAGRLAGEVSEPTGHIHASTEYRKAMAEIYARRALQDAYARARPGA